MTIAVGDRIPDVQLKTPTESGPQVVTSTDVLGKGKVVLFAVPGAFTPTCSDFHLPGFVLRSEEIRAKGVDRIACLAVNDAFVLGAWGKEHQVDDKVVLLADGNGELTSAMGLENDLKSAGLGMRSRRFAAIIEDGVVTHLAVEDGGGLNVSSADKILEALG